MESQWEIKKVNECRGISYTFKVKSQSLPPPPQKKKKKKKRTDEPKDGANLISPSTPLARAIIQW